MKTERKKFTEAYQRGEVTFLKVELLVCCCRSFRFSHDPERHKELLSDKDWRTWEQRREMEVWEPWIR